MSYYPLCPGCHHLSCESLSYSDDRVPIEQHVYQFTDDVCRVCHQQAKIACDSSTIFWFKAKRYQDELELIEAIERIKGEYGWDDIGIQRRYREIQDRYLSSYAVP